MQPDVHMIVRISKDHRNKQEALKVFYLQIKDIAAGKKGDFLNQLILLSLSYMLGFREES